MQASLSTDATSFLDPERRSILLCIKKVDKTKILPIAIGWLTLL